MHCFSRPSTIILDKAAGTTRPLKAALLPEKQAVDTIDLSVVKKSKNSGNWVFIYDLLRITRGVCILWFLIFDNTVAILW